MKAWTTRWPLGIALLCFFVGTLFGANAGQDFERWVITGLWLAVGLVWVALWRMDVGRRRRAAQRAAQSAAAASSEGDSPAG